MARVHKVKQARKPIPSAGIKIGDSYYWWKFRYGGKQVSKTYPKKSQLTQSDFLQRVYSMQEQLDELTPEVELEEFKDNLLQEIEELRDEQEEKLNNMPDSLQEGPTGELLQERYDALDNFYNEIDGIETEIDEENFLPSEDWEDYYDPESDNTKDIQKEEYDLMIKDEKSQWLEEEAQRIVDEFQEITVEL